MYGNNIHKHIHFAICLNIAVYFKSSDSKETSIAQINNHI